MSKHAKSPNPIDVYVGSRVRMRRMLIGMSQEKLGESLGITFQQIQKYEKGSNRIGASRLQHLATVLKVPVGFFFEGAPGSPEEAADSTAPDTQRLLTQPRAIDLLEAYSKCSGETQRSIICIAQAAADGTAGATQVAA